MDFKRLKASIENHEDQDPSVYTALCMIQSLFRDVEEAADKNDISECSAADEQLPSKLIWLSRTILEIYEANLDSFQLNRERLDSVMDQLRSAEQSLEELDVDAAKLQFLQDSLKKTNGELEAARARKAAFDDLTVRIEAAQHELESLRNFDPGTASTEFEALNDEITTLKKDNELLQENLQQLHRSKETAAEQQEELFNQITAANLDFENARSALAKSKEDHELALQNKKLQEDELRRANSALGIVRGEINDLTGNRIPAAKRLLGIAEGEKAGLENDLNDLTRDTGKMQDEIDQLRQTLPDQEDLFNSTKQLYDELTGAYKARSAKLEQMEEKIRELEEQSVSERLTTYENQLNQTLGALQKTDQRCRDTAEQNRLKKQELQEKQQKLNDLRALKETHDRTLQEIDQNLLELNEAAQPGYQLQLDQLLEQLSVLGQTRSELANSICLMHDILGTSPVSTDAPLRAQIKTEIDNLTAYTNNLRKALVRCSDSLNLEVKQ